MAKGYFRGGTAVISVTLLVNGPGELWGWCRPLAQELKRQKKHVTIWLLPCQFASGREAEAAVTIGADEVKGPYSATETLRALKNHQTDVVLQMGGDLLFGHHIARKRDVPLFCYTYGQKKGLHHCNAVFTAYEAMARQISSETIVVGDLVKEGVFMDEGPSPWQDEDGVKLVFFPGSRPAIRNKALPFLSEVTYLLREKIETLQVTTLLSPFSKIEEQKMWEDEGMNPSITGTGIVLKEADIALTQPGTNTLELMHMSVPTLVAVPFAFLREIPLSGIKSFITSLPTIGPAIKEKILRSKAAHRTTYLAWPNRLVKKQIMRESVGELHPSDVANELYDLWQNREAFEVQKTQLLKLSQQSRDMPSKSISAMIERLCVHE